MRFDELTIALLTVGVPVEHYFARKRPDKYIVWAEDGGADALLADDRTGQQAVSGTVDYFTKQEYDPNVDTIQAALNNAEIPWRYNSVQYETNTGFIHHEWTWELIVWHDSK